jgi:adenylate cyclase
MAEEGFKRKLAAILIADVVGYSRLMDDNEEATIRTINIYRASITKLIHQHKGRVVDATGDNLLAEFVSAVNAVNCAVEIQRELAEQNAELSDERKMYFRIGVNVGDVVEEENRIYGDGVNIAARVEGLARAGGICISGRVYDQVENKLDFEYEFQGKQKVKNIKRPVRIYRVLSYPGAAAHRVIRAKKLIVRKWQKVTVAIAAFIALCLVVTFFTWNNYFRLPSVTTAVAGDLSFDLPEGPSIAVLPFDNMSGDSEQDFFSDGLTENIITALATCSNLFVIARNSTFVYKGKAVKIKQLASELGVQYVLEGSVQKTNNRVRINAQLIDSLTEHHIWAKKYDRDLQNIFDLQDEITFEIMTNLQVTLTEGEQARYRSKDKYNLEAYLKVLKALELFRRQNKEDNALARQTMEEAIELDSDNPQPYILIALTHLQDIWYGTKYPILSFVQASKSINQAFKLDNKNSDAYLALCRLYMLKKQHEEAKSAVEQAIFYNPNGADAFCQLGSVLYYSDKPIEAIGMIKKAIRLNPYPPAYYYNNMGNAYFALSRYKEAEQAYIKSISIEPDMFLAHMSLTGTLSLMGKEKEAREQAKEVLRLTPDFEASRYEKTSPNRNREVVKRFIEALRKAGLPY